MRLSDKTSVDFPIPAFLSSTLIPAPLSLQAGLRLSLCPSGFCLLWLGRDALVSRPAGEMVELGVAMKLESLVLWAFNIVDLGDLHAEHL